VSKLKVLSADIGRVSWREYTLIGVASGADLRALMPQRGNGLQPRVAASATLGKETDLALNRNAVAPALCISL